MQYGYVPQAIAQQNPQYQTANPLAHGAPYDPNFNYSQGRYYTQQELQALGRAPQQQVQQQTQASEPNLMEIFKKASTPEAAKEGATAATGTSGGSAALPATQSVVTGSTPQGMEAVGTMADGSTMYAPVAESNMFGSLGGALPVAGLAGMGAYMYNRGDSLLRHMDNDRGSMKDSMGTAWKEATKKPANALLAFNPVTGPAYWGAAALNGLRHISPETRQRRRSQEVAGKVDGGDAWYNASIEGNPDVKAQWKSALEAASPDFVGYDNNGMWLNKKFANSRSEADLRPEDIWQSAQMLQTFGNDWNSGKYTDKRREVAQALLDNKLIDERKGGIYFQKGQEARAKEIADQVIGGNYNTSSTGTGLSNYMNNNGTDLSGFKGVLKSGIGAGLASTPTVQTRAGQSVADPNAGKKPGDVGYDWLAARAIRKGQYTG